MSLNLTHITQLSARLLISSHRFPIIHDQTEYNKINLTLETAVSVQSIGRRLRWHKWHLSFWLMQCGMEKTDIQFVCELKTFLFPRAYSS